MSMSMDMDMSMDMSFSFTCDVGPLLFSWWNISNCTSYFLSFIPVILLGAARHWTFSCVAGSRRSQKGCSQTRTTALLDGPGFRSSNEVEQVSRGTRLVWTLLSTAGSALSLLSMLVVMTYNSGLFIAVLLGEALGYWIWGNHSLPDTMRACH